MLKDHLNKKGDKLFKILIVSNASFLLRLTFSGESRGFINNES